MKKWAIYILLIMVLVGCTNKNTPDVSDIKIELQTQRFDQDFFAIDTLKTGEALQQLYIKYPKFLQDFVYNILALNPHPDSSLAVEKSVVSFINSYRPVKDSSDLIFTDFKRTEDEIKKGLQFFKHYFPDYKQPSKLITFIGPINSYGNVLTTDAMAVGLQMYMGSNYTLYNSPAVQELYPSYVSRRFSKEYIPVNCMKSLLDDLYPDNTVGKPLIEQMIYAGKKLYLLDHVLPNTHDTLKTGYTRKQLDGCFENERTIWSFFVRNDLLYISDPSATRDYMNDAPMTQAFGNESPGFIGQFVGWQIVKKWMEKNEEKSLKDLIETSEKAIFEQAKYKP